MKSFFNYSTIDKVVLKNKSYSEYRDSLAEQISSARKHDKNAAREILQKARQTPEYYIQLFSKRDKKQYDIVSFLENYMYKGFFDTSDGSLFSDSKEIIGNLNLAYRNPDSMSELKLRNILIQGVSLIDEIDSITYKLKLQELYKKAVSIVISDLIKKIEGSNNGIKSDLSEDEISKLIKANYIYNERTAQSIVYQIRSESTSELESCQNFISETRNTRNYLLSLIKDLEEKGLYFTPEKDFISIFDRSHFNIGVEEFENYISVFHFARADVVKYIDRYGLLTLKQRGSVRILNEEIDTRTGLNDTKVNRSKCIYAYANIDDLTPSYFNDDFVLLEILVDPNECFVADYNDTTQALDDAWHSIHGHTSYDSNNRFKNYRVEPFENFIDGTDKFGKRTTSIGSDKEILIMSGVPQSRIRLANVSFPSEFDRDISYYNGIRVSEDLS